MKAVVCNAFGPVSDLKIQETGAPIIRPGTVRIRVAAAAVNPPDNLMPQGKYQVKPEFPFVLGLECAGIITETGSGVADLGVGDRVMTYAGHGCFADEVVVPAELVYKMPAGMPFEMAAGFAVAYGTAYHGLVERGQLKKGETVAILGAAGGIGLCAIQIAKAVGAHVIAVASTPEKRELCRANGADHALSSDPAGLKTGLLELSGGKGVHVVHDTVGGPLSMAALRGIRPYGRHLIVGYASGEIQQIPANYVLLKQVSVVGVSFRQCAQDNSALAQAGMRALGGLWEAGLLAPCVSRTYPFERFQDALNALSSGTAVGKLIIRIAEL